MKIRRQKRVQRILSFYRNNFGFQSPYKVLLDGTFCMGALEEKINLREQILKYLGDEKVEIWTTTCVLRELKILGDPCYGAYHIAQQFQKIPCNHGKPCSASDCFLEIASDPENKFFLGTQDKELTEKIREFPHCPVLFVKYKTVLLNKPTDLSLKTADLDIQERLKAQKEALPELKKKILGDSWDRKDKGKRFRRRKIKGPNPLSCKKKKKKVKPDFGTELGKKRKYRSRKKLEECGDA